MAKKSMIAKAKRTPKHKVQRLSPLLRVRSTARLHAPVRALPHLLPRASAPAASCPASRSRAGREPMNISDPIADMLTRVRNASRARHTEVVVPASRTKREIARILKDEGFIADVTRGAGRPDGGPAPHPQVRRRQGPGRLRPQADQQARPARLRAQDGHPARARRPGHRHRQHEPGDHDRPAGASGAAGRRSPRLRLVGRTTCRVSDASPSPSRRAST